MLAKLSWKNIWRNKTRSIVILDAIALGIFAGTYLSAFISGWMIGTVNDEINASLSHIQIRDSAFAANNDMGAYFSISNIENRKLEELNAKIAYRLHVNGMLSSAGNAVGVQANGVNPEDEMRVFTVWQTIPDTLGAFLPADMRMPIVISAKTAEKLKVRLRSKIVLSFQNVEGEMQSMAFRVCGIFRTANTTFDEGHVFARYDDLFPATALPEGAAHVAAIKFNDASGKNALPLREVDKIAPEIKALFPDYDVKTWRELNLMISMSLEMTGMMAAIILSIFLLALAFGIINTLLMAVLERTRELGMLGAIGMSKGRIFRMILLETVFLTLVGGAAGMILATLALIPSIRGGIDLTPLMGDHFEDYGFSSVIFPVMDITMFVEITLLVVATGILSAIYPARKALKIKPLEAMKE